MTGPGEDCGLPPFRQKRVERMGHGRFVGNMNGPVEDRGLPPFRDETAKGWGTQVIQVRRMRLEDIDRVMAIANELKEAPHWPRETYAGAIDPGGRPARIALIAEGPGAEIVGFAMAVLIPPLAELETIAVAPAAQRQGIASRLFSELRAELNKLQITEVILEVRESNRAARALYHALGFAESGRRRGYYLDPPEDALLLRRPV